MATLTLYHGSQEIVGQPIYGVGNPHNDYGLGFYCTKHVELAREWACPTPSNGYVNQYILDSSPLSILALNTEPYTILHWLALLMANRAVRLSTPLMQSGAAWLTEHFLPDTRPYDVIAGYRADDSYFSFARAFLANEISLEQLRRAMRLGELGEQVMLKSEAAFSAIRFISSDAVSYEVYHPLRQARDEAARNAYEAELEATVLDGLFIRDLMREEVSPDDPRLR